MRNTVTCLSLVVISFTSGCNFQIGAGVPGSGVSVTQTREIPDFSELSLVGSGDVYVQVGKPTALEITLDDNLLESFETEVADNVLRLQPTRNINPTSGPDIVLSTGQLSAASIVGSGDVEIKGIASESLEVKITGSGDMRIQGTVKELNVRISGSGSADLRELDAQKVDARVAGSGDIQVNAQESLNVFISGSGDVRYAGSAQVTQQISGSGSVSVLPAPADTAPAADAAQAEVESGDIP